jgi:hypothetical protein
MAGLVPGSIPGLFATSNGDGAVVHTILEAIATNHPVSPTQFHNSVHNTSAGYWSIATRSQQPITCITGGVATAAMALLKAVAEVQAENGPLLLCVYDVPLPFPLDMKRPTDGIFGVGLVLCPEQTQAGMARVAAHYERTAPCTRETLPRLPALHRLATGNPAGRLLRLLESLAGGAAETFSMALLDGWVKVSVEPCSAVGTFSN